MERAAVPIEVALQPSCLECVFPIGPSHMDQLSRAVTAPRQRSPITTPPASPLQISSFRLRPYMVADFLQLAWEHRLLARGWCELSRACSLTISELVGQWKSVACEIRACLFAPNRDAVRALLPCLLMVPPTAYDCLCVRTYGISAPVVELFLHHAAKNGNLAVSARKELDSALKCVPASVCIWEEHHISNRDLVEALSPGQAGTNARAVHALATTMLAITASCRVKTVSDTRFAATIPTASKDSSSSDGASSVEEMMFEMVL